VFNRNHNGINSNFTDKLWTKLFDLKKRHQEKKEKKRKTIDKMIVFLV
jgi:hypothetical protein